MIRFFKQHWPILPILAIGTTLRLVAIFRYGSFWFDEMFSFVYSQKPWLDSLRFWVWETNPPLHMFLLKLWFYLAPQSELMARLPSLIAAIATIIFIYFIGAKLFNRRIGAFVALLLALSPQHILFSITARTYAILILLSLLCGYYFIKIFFLNKTNSKKEKIIFIVLHILLLYSHLTALSLLASEFFIITAYDHKKLKNWLALIIITILPWLIWAIPSLSFKLNTHTYQQAWFFNIALDYSNYTKTLQMILLGFFKNPFYVLPLLLFYLLLLVSTIYKISKQHIHRPLFLVILSLAVFPFLFAVVAGTLEPKFYIICLPWVFLAIAYLLSNNLPIWITLIFFIIFIPGLQIFYTIFPISNWTAVNNYLVTNIPAHHKTVFVYNSFINKNEVDYYLHLSIPIIYYLPHPTNSWDRFLITENYFRLQETSKKITTWAVNNRLFDFDDIFLMQMSNNAYSSVDIAGVLTENGFHQTTAPVTMPVFGSSVIHHFVK